METIKHLNKWANAHTYYSLDFLRIALGLIIFIKGLFYMSNPLILMETIAPMKNYLSEFVVLHYLISAHLVGGILIIFGLLTRWAIMVQLPIIIGAVIINFLGVMNFNNLLLAVAVLLISLFFIVYGSGKHSADYYLKMEQ